MENFLNKKIDPVLVGFLQSLGIALYSALIGAFLFYIPILFRQPGIVGIFLMLLVFVFSAAITGSLVFALPAYLAINKRIKEAAALLAYTLFFFFLIIVLTVLAVFVLSR